MKDILKKFATIAKIIENVDVSKYRAFKLKQRLMKSYPQLVFCVPKMRNVSEILYMLKIWILLNWLRNICEISLKTRMKKTVPLIIIIYILSQKLRKILKLMTYKFYTTLQ